MDQHYGLCCPQIVCLLFYNGIYKKVENKYLKQLILRVVWQGGVYYEYNYLKTGLGTQLRLGVLA